MAGKHDDFLLRRAERSSYKTAQIGHWLIMFSGVKQARPVLTNLKRAGMSMVEVECLCVWLIGSDGREDVLC